MDVDPIVEHDNHDIAGPESEKPMNNGHGILHQALRLLPHKGVGNKETTDEEEDVDSQEGPGHEDKEELLDNAWNASDVDVIL